jgi:hypothetical protein
MKVYESDLTEAIYEVIANTNFSNEGHEYMQGLRMIEDSNFELNKDNAVINIEIGNEVFQIRVTKTHQLKPYSYEDISNNK